MPNHDVATGRAWEQARIALAQQWSISAGFPEPIRAVRPTIQPAWPGIHWHTRPQPMHLIGCHNPLLAIRPSVAALSIRKHEGTTRCT